MIQVPVVKQYQNNWCGQATPEQRSSTSTSEELEVSQLAGSLKSMLLKLSLELIHIWHMPGRNDVVYPQSYRDLHELHDSIVYKDQYAFKANQLWPCTWCIMLFLQFRKWKQRPHGRRLLTADKTLVGACHRHSSDKI